MRVELKPGARAEVFLVPRSSAPLAVRLGDGSTIRAKAGDSVYLVPAEPGGTVCSGMLHPRDTERVLAESDIGLVVFVPVARPHSVLMHAAEVSASRNRYTVRVYSGEVLAVWAAGPKVSPRDGE